MVSVLKGRTRSTSSETAQLLWDVCVSVLLGGSAEELRSVWRNKFLPLILTFHEKQRTELGTAGCALEFMRFLLAQAEAELCTDKLAVVIRQDNKEVKIPMPVVHYESSLQTSLNAGELGEYTGVQSMPDFLFVELGGAWWGRNKNTTTRKEKSTEALLDELFYGVFTVQNTKYRASTMAMYNISSAKGHHWTAGVIDRQVNGVVRFLKLDDVACSKRMTLKRACTRSGVANGGLRVIMLEKLHEEGAVGTPPAPEEAALPTAFILVAKGRLCLLWVSHLGLLHTSTFHRCHFHLVHHPRFTFHKFLIFFFIIHKSEESHS